MFKHLFNIHKGQTCIVIGNGPSLNRVPNSFLDTHLTFGCNRIYLRYSPTYYVVINELVYRQFRTEMEEFHSSVKFVREGMKVKDSVPLHLIETPMFSFSPTVWMYDGHNTTFVSLQLAFFMGFEKVLLVGVDHRYKYDGLPNEPLFMQEDDPNHFSKDYFKGHQWQAPDLEVSTHAYKMAKEAYENNGRKIVNMTPGSDLDVFDFEEPIWEQLAR